MKHLLATSFLTLLVGFNIFSQHTSITPQLKSLIDAEVSFAKLSVEKGIQASFLAWFADEGITFEPEPVNLKVAWGGRPAPKKPSPVVLNWAPIYGDISYAGDLGYSTGPYVVEDRSPKKQPSQHGLFFSIWKKQADGNWKVVVDLGVPQAAEFAPLGTQYRPATDGRHRNPLPRSEALAKMVVAEKSFSEAAQSGGAGPAWKAWLSNDARIYRPGLAPVIGAAELKRWIALQHESYSCQNMKADLAASGDLGYTIGSYDISGQNLAGYYVRVWKLDHDAQWRIVFDVTNIVPKG